jgi:hypothetical protein
MAGGAGLDEAKGDDKDEVVVGEFAEEEGERRCAEESRIVLVEVET